jgi:hypothetical protein
LEEVEQTPGRPTEDPPSKKATTQEAMEAKRREEAALEVQTTKGSVVRYPKGAARFIPSAMLFERVSNLLTTTQIMLIT